MSAVLALQRLAGLGCGARKHTLGQCRRQCAPARHGMHRIAPLKPRPLGLAPLAAAQQAPGEPSPEVMAKVADMLGKAQELEYTGRMPEAVAMLRQGLAELAEAPALAAQGGFDMSTLAAQQRVSHLLFTMGDYPAAVEEARQVYDRIVSTVGEDSGEAVLFGLRLGILEAASGDLATGNMRIYRAGALVAPNLQQMVQQAQQIGEQGGQDALLGDLEAAIQKLTICLGESNFFGALFTLRRLVQEGKADAVVSGWENLDAGVVHGMTNMALALTPETHSLKNALREHRRLVEEMADVGEVGEKLQDQQARLKKLVHDAQLQKAQLEQLQKALQ